jgi:hypothetical protein
MDFIERWFGVSPDGSDGSLELLYVAVAALAVSLWLARRRLARASRRETVRPQR